MTEEIKPDDNGKLQPEPEKPKDIVMTINLAHETGQLSVQAPGNGQMYDLPMAFYLMELAKDHIKAVNRANSQSRIIQSNPSMAQQVRGIFKRRR
jgi:hypothetical protein